MPLSCTCTHDAPCILDFRQAMSSLDAVISLGIIARENNFIRPEIVGGSSSISMTQQQQGKEEEEDDAIIVIKSGRHPLQCLTNEAFVPNDTFISPAKNIALITGPNSSGKSVYLKQVGMCEEVRKWG